MGQLINRLVSENLINEWAEILDWLLDENKFSPQKRWTPQKVGLFTKSVKRQLSVKDANYKYDSVKNLCFKTTSNENTMIFSRSESEGRDIVRHIRNGIAHGRCEIRKSRNVLFIQIKDYNRTGDQTAYMYIPLDSIRTIHKIYKEKEKNNVYSKTKKKATKNKSV